MRVRIVSLGDKLSSGIEVTFSTLYGMGKGEWIGQLPSVGSEYVVEFDIKEDLVWGSTISQISSRVMAVRQEDSQMTLQGEIESVDPDGFCTLRIDDSLMVLGITGKVPAPGTFVMITTEHLHLYDTNI